MNTDLDRAILLTERLLKTKKGTEYEIGIRAVLVNLKTLKVYLEEPRPEGVVRDEDTCI